ncbi:MAG: ArsR/SmtB family transcription factor [Maricaulaceae bacterium]
MENIAQILKVLGHPERLRILALLSRGELTVSELVQIMELSQPRMTQYINSLEKAGIIERLKEGSWVFSRLRRGNAAVTALVATTLSALPESDEMLQSDLARLEDVRAERSKAAEAFFANVANDRGQLGHEYLPQDDIERAMTAAVGDGPFDFMVDLGTGTGRVLSVFADKITRGSGIDNNTQMLKVARHKLASEGHDHISVRQGNLLNVPLETGCADLVTIHQVLHYLDDPSEAITEAARLLRPGGQLLIVDFETHTLDEFRETYAHRRLGFTDQDLGQWLGEHNLRLAPSTLIQSSDAKRPNVKIWSARLPRFPAYKEA